MAWEHDTSTYKKSLLHFMGEADPFVFSAPAVDRTGDGSRDGDECGNKHTADRTTHFSGIRVRRFETRLGPLYTVGSEASSGRLCTLFCDQEEATGAGPDPSSARGIQLLDMFLLLILTSCLWPLNCVFTFWRRGSYER